MNNQKKLDTQVGYLLVATLTASGTTYETYEVMAYMCGSCDKIHIGWMEKGFPSVGDCSPENLGKAFVHEITFDKLEARLVQLNKYEPEKAYPVFRAAFAEWLERADTHISNMTQALLL